MTKLKKVREQAWDLGYNPHTSSQECIPQSYFLLEY